MPFELLSHQSWSTGFLQGVSQHGTHSCLSRCFHNKTSSTTKHSTLPQRPATNNDCNHCFNKSNNTDDNNDDDDSSQNDFQQNWLVQEKSTAPSFGQRNSPLHVGGIQSGWSLILYFNLMTSRCRQFHETIKCFDFNNRRDKMVLRNKMLHFRLGSLKNFLWKN